MDHFEQDLRGDIRSMIAGQTFFNFQEMYQRAVKIVRVLEESRLEKQALEAGKRKKGQPGRGYPSNKRFKYDNYQGKGKQPAEGGTIPECKFCGKHHRGVCVFAPRCFECREPGRMARDCPNRNQNEPRRQPPSDQPRSTAPAGRGRPPAARSNQQPGNVRKPQAGGRVFCLEVEAGNEDPHAVMSDAAKTGAAQEAMQNTVLRASRAITEQEARQILGVTENAAWEEILKKYDVLFERNAKHGSFYLQSKVHRAKECLEGVHQNKGPGTAA